jgi:hypothetical protein
MDAVVSGPGEDLGYRRPPVTASFAALRRQGLPEVLFVLYLPEGVTVCDITEFAALIEELYCLPGALLLDTPDETGHQLCRGVGNFGPWQWAVITPGRRSGWRMMLAPEHEHQRQVTFEASTFEHGRMLIGDTLATFPISARPDGRPPAASLLQRGPLDAMGYRRPPAAISFDDLSQRGLPRVLFVNTHLPEGVTVCDVTVFAAMIKEAYAAGGLHYVRPDEHGNDQCVGLGGTGIWEWWVTRPSKPIDGDRWDAIRHSICRILSSPETDGKRICTVDLDESPGHEPEEDRPITFTIRTRPVSMESLERALAAGDDPADVAEGVDLTLSWLADSIPAAAGLLRLLAFLPPEPPIPLNSLLLNAPRTADLPGPEAAAVIGPLLGNPAAAGEASRGVHAMSFVSYAGALRVRVHPLARAAVRAQLTGEESAHWQQAAVALVEAAVTADPQILLPYAEAVRRELA